MEQYLIIIEKGENNYSAYSPDVLGCVAAGKTIDQTLRRMKEALRLHLEDIHEQGGLFPRAKGLEAHLEEINPDNGEMFTFIAVEPDIFAVAA